MKLLTFLQLTEARDGLSHVDAMKVIREIETGRGGIAELVGKKPALTKLSQEKLRSEHGDVVPLFRVLAVPEGKEVRKEGIVSTTTDWKVAVAMGKDQPGVVMDRGKFTSIAMVLLRYDTPIERCLADVDMLLDMAVEAIGGIPPDNIKIKGRRGGDASIAHLIRSGMDEHEVVADVTGIEPVMLNYPSHVNGQKEMDMLRGLDAGDYNSPDEYMAHRIANKGDNEFFSDEEEAELKAMYAKRAPVVKQWLGMNEELYHATEYDIDEFNPLSHFGSPKAASDRAYQLDDTIDDRPAIRTYKANLPLKNPVKMYDDGGYHDYAIQIAKGIVKHYRMVGPDDPAYKMMHELKAMIDRWSSKNIRKHDEESRAELIAFLKSHGYDGIEYENNREDAGSKSYMNLDPVVAESVSGQYVYHATPAKNLGAIMGKGLTMFNPSLWMKAGTGERYQDEPSVYAFEHPWDAYKWAHKIEWEYKEPAVIVKLKKGPSWERDPSEDVTVQMGKGAALMSKDPIPASAVATARTKDQLGTPASTGLSMDEFADHVEDVMEKA